MLKFVYNIWVRFDSIDITSRRSLVLYTNLGKRSVVRRFDVGRQFSRVNQFLWLLFICFWSCAREAEMKNLNVKGLKGVTAPPVKRSLKYILFIFIHLLSIFLPTFQRREWWSKNYGDTVLLPRPWSSLVEDHNTFFKKNGPFQASFSLFSSFEYSWQ